MDYENLLMSSLLAKDENVWIGQSNYHEAA